MDCSHNIEYGSPESDAVPKEADRKEHKKKKKKKEKEKKCSSDGDDVCIYSDFCFAELCRLEIRLVSQLKVHGVWTSVILIWDTKHLVGATTRRLMNVQRHRPK